MRRGMKNESVGRMWEQVAAVCFKVLPCPSPGQPKESNTKALDDFLKMKQMF
jgi:hypothetical protein